MINKFDEDLEALLEDLLEELMADGWRSGVDWKGYSVIEPVYDKVMCMGLPYVILIKGDDARICEPDEAIEYLNYKENKKTSEIKDAILKEYFMKFNECPPLLYSLDYDDEIVIEMMKKALKKGKPFTINDYPEEVGERVITGLVDPEEN